MKTTIEKSTGYAIEPKVAVVGIGGAGCNVASDIYWADGSVDIIAVNTDRRALSEASADKKLYICKEVTKGEGTRGDNLVGRKCAKIHAEEIEEALKGYDTVFIIAGVGGGTGSGVAPVVADIAQRLNAITFAILINPFSFESARTRTAMEGIAHTKAVCRMTMVVENDLVMRSMPDATMEEAFKAVNMSITSYIVKQKDKVFQAFADQLENIAEVAPRVRTRVHRRIGPASAMKWFKQAS